MAVTDYELDSDVEAGGRPLTQVLPAGFDPAEMGDELDEDDLPQLLGHTVFYTVGDFVVNRAWLKKKIRDLGLPSWMIPNPMTEKRAFKQINERLVDDRHDANGVPKNVFPTEGEGGAAEVETRIPTDDTGNKVNDEIHLVAQAYTPATDDDGEGEYDDYTLGVFRFNGETRDLMVRPKIGKSDELWSVWADYRDDARDLFREMQNSHTGRDIQKMLYNFTHHWTKSVKLRDAGAVYFVPARHAETTRLMKILVTEMGELFKEDGHAVELQRVPVMDTEEQNYMVEQRARIAIEERIDSALDTFFDEMADAQTEDVDDEDLIGDLTGVLRDALEDVDDLENEYNTLLQAEISARSVVQEWLADQGTPENRARDAIETAAESVFEEEPVSA